MTPDEFRRYGHQAIDWIADYLTHPERYPVLPPVKPGELIDALPPAGPDCGGRAHGSFSSSGGEPRGLRFHHRLGRALVLEAR